MHFIYFLIISIFLLGCSNKPENTIKTADTITTVDSITKVDSITPVPPANISNETTEQTPIDTCACEVSAYLNDPDESGTNVRDIPKGKIIRKLMYDKDCGCLIERFKSSKNGWLELSDGGWVFAELFSVSTRNYGEDKPVYLKELPSSNSKTVATYYQEQSVKVVGCCKKWLQVKGRDGKIGYLDPEMVCDNPLTTCP